MSETMIPVTAICGHEAFFKQKGDRFDINRRDIAMTRPCRDCRAVANKTREQIQKAASASMASVVKSKARLKSQAVKLLPPGTMIILNKHQDTGRWWGSIGKVGDQEAAISEEANGLMSVVQKLAVKLIKSLAAPVVPKEVPHEEETQQHQERPDG